jgi:hypothetical protein
MACYDANRHEPPARKSKQWKPHAGRSADSKHAWLAPKRSEDAENIFCPRGSAQAIEKARFGQGNPRKSKPFFLAKFGLGLAGLCSALLDLERILPLGRRARRDHAESACRTSREQLGFVRDLFTREGDSPPDRA